MPKFRTRWNCHIDDGEVFEPGSSLTQPGQSESLLHIVQRLTRKPDPTMRDLYVIAKETGQEFEDPTTLSDEELNERMERVVGLGDDVDAAEALLDAQSDLFVAQTVAENEAKAKAKREPQPNESREDEQKTTSESA